MQNLPFSGPNAFGFSSPGSTNEDIVPERRLASRVINLSASPSPNAPPLSSDWPDAASDNGSPPLAPTAPTSNAASSSSVANAQASSPPLVGIVSGKPMPDYPVWPSIFDTEDRVSPGDDELFQRWMRWVDA